MTDLQLSGTITLSDQQAIRTATPPSVTEFLNPLAALRNLWTHREVTWQFAKRDIQSRYRGANLGLLWTLITPIMLLAIYTFVFAVVFKARWGEGEETRGVFAMTMFCGMLVYNLFAEVVNRSPTLIVQNPNYVKKVIFPLEIFVVSSLLGALFNMIVGFLVWMVGMGIFVGVPPATVLWLPVVVLPVCLITLGIAWALAAIGVFIRDIQHAVVLVVQILFFITPIFYSIDRVPQPFRRALEINPLTHAVEDVRRVMMYGQSPTWGWWAGSLVASVVVALCGYALFTKSKRAFADVI